MNEPIELESLRRAMDRKRVAIERAEAQLRLLWKKLRAQQSEYEAQKWRLEHCE